MHSPSRCAIALSLGLSLSACVIAPIDPKTGQPYPLYAQPYPPQPAPVVVVQPPSAALPPVAATAAPNIVQARLYPANDIARQSGMLSASVLDNAAGRGTFQVAYGAQLMQGEATRVDRNYPGFGQVLSRVHGNHSSWSNAAGQRGIANAAGGTGSLRCEYLFTTPTQGTGACVGHDGALFQIHFGS